MEIRVIKRGVEGNAGPDIYVFECPICNKVIRSLSYGQCHSNARAHMSVHISAEITQKYAESGVGIDREFLESIADKTVREFFEAHSRGAGLLKGYYFFRCKYCGKTIVGQTVEGLYINARRHVYMRHRVRSRPSLHGGQS